MEKIIQAIGKAVSKGEPDSEGQGQPTQSQAALGGTGIDAIEYQQTRIVDLNPAHLERNRIVAHNKSDPASRVFDLLRTQVLQKMEEKGWRTLGVTSPTAEAGKTVVAINLALSMSHQTQKTALLADFDLRRPKVGAYMGLPQDASLNEVLEGNAAMFEAMINPGLPRLVVLPTLRTVANPSETLFSRQVANLVTDVRERYDSRIAIFDLPPLLNTDDAIAVLPQMDCVLLVVGEGMSPNAEIEECMRLIPREKLLGVVLNKAEEAQKTYY